MPFQDHFDDHEFSILQGRALRLATLLANEDTSGRIAALRVRLGGEMFIFPLDELVTIVDDATITPVPCVPAHIAGIANVRGRVVPVIDLATLLGLATEQTDERPVLIVAMAADDRVSLAFKVQAIDELVTVEQQSISPLPSDFETAYPEFFIGISEENRVLINTGTILASEMLVVNDTAD